MASNLGGTESVGDAGVQNEDTAQQNVAQQKHDTLHLTHGPYPAARADRDFTNQDFAEHDFADWKRAHAELTRLARTRAGLDWQEGQWLVRAIRAGAHARLGFGSFAEYAERLFGYSPRFTLEKLRVAETLEELPELSQSLRDGEFTWSAVRELTRVAVPKTEGEWLAAARGRSVREVERLVSGHEPGDRPKDPQNPKVRRHVLRFEVSGETLAFFREALAKLRRDAGEPLDDDAALLLLARQALGGPKDAGRASYQVALDVCETCRRGQQTGRGELVEVGREIVEMAECDAQHIGPARSDAPVGATPAPARATQTIPPAVRRQVMRRDNGRCVVPGCRHGVWVDVHHLDPRADGGGHDPENLACMCGAHHRAIHAGKLLVAGFVSSGLVFRHADGTPYGGAVSPGAAQPRTTVFQLLTHMGFRESESHRAVERASAHVGREGTRESLLRAALAVLTPAATG